MSSYQDNGCISFTLPSFFFFLIKERLKECSLSDNLRMQYSNLVILLQFVGYRYFVYFLKLEVQFICFEQRIVTTHVELFRIEKPKNFRLL